MPYLFAVLLLCLVFLGGCAITPVPNSPNPNSAESDCLARLQQTDRALENAGLMPSSPAPVAGFPHYRVTRFLAEFGHEDLSPIATAAWLQSLSQQAQQSRAIAFNTNQPVNLPAAGLEKALQDCTQRLIEFDLTQPERLQTLRQRAVVADDYITAARIIGLYPLFAIPVRRGIQKLHAEFRHTFTQALQDLPQQGQLLHYAPESEAKPADLNSPLARDALGIPQPTAPQLQALFLRHAPLWAIDVAANYDRPGRPIWRTANTPGVDTRQAISFHYASYTQWQGQPVLQLNYLIWFDQRPLQGTFDILGGALDAVLWRVTLGPDQRPLLYDSIHACGCYHLFFPATELRLKPAAKQLPEPPFVAQAVPTLNPNERLLIRLASATHYIERVYPASQQMLEATQRYTLVDYNALYRTPRADGGQRSLFQASGLVAGTERAERALLWPLGVEEPGAMRERGRHPVAFLGRRHFDDAQLIDSLFEPAE
jgi:hypothetical protein